ncbi:MAG: tRNA pseudouridine(13) synthase TruD [Euryarchaeota archaeon]|nr:tRNA pseudouridine(13) synthase TruD [Euryarchaeota archaeon]
MADPLAEGMGLSGYTVESKGIGGMLKMRVSDFRVDEESKSVSTDNKGRFTLARITLTNWETNRFVKQLAKRLRISSNRIWFAGTKDKKAITKQLFVIDTHVKNVASVDLKDVEIDILGRTHQKLGFGSHRGNRFTIIVRGCAHQDGSPMSENEALEQVDYIRDSLEEMLGKGRFPNFIGPQRFGANRPVTPEFGRFLVKDDVAGAVSAYIGFEGQSESEEVEKFRSHWREHGDAEAAIELAPKHLGWEREMLHHLIKNPEDYIGAFTKMPKSLQLLGIHALQSLVFNHLLQNRIKDNQPITTPIIGDVVGPVDESGSLESKRMVLANESTLPRLQRNCQMGRLVPTGVLPGSESENLGDHAKKAMEDLKLQNFTWKVKAIPRLSSRGARRPLVSTFRELVVDTVPKADPETLDMRWNEGPQEGSRWHPEGACLRFRFTLPSGTYATTLLKEFMRVPIRQL